MAQSKYFGMTLRRNFIHTEISNRLNSRNASKKSLLNLIFFLLWYLKLKVQNVQNWNFLFCMSMKLGLTL
jgi:hypothetical protein